jgi:hypothetical protein
MLDTTGVQPKCAKQLKDEEVVRSLVEFQSANGSFDILNWENLFAPTVIRSEIGIDMRGANEGSAIPSKWKPTGCLKYCYYDFS